MNNTLLAALEWYASGLTVIPVKSHSKKPFADFKWSTWQKIKAPLGIIAHWFNYYTDCNIAILCGAINKNLVIIDFDTMLSYATWLTETDSQYHKTHIVKSARGYHVYFFVKHLPTKSIILPDIDVKTSGYCLIPPSTHPSGIQYTILSDKAIMSIDSLDDVLPLRCLEGGGDSIVDTPTSTPPHSRQCTTTLYNGVISDIKSRIDILSALGLSQPDVVKNGQRDFVKCPLHNDNDPSLDVDLQTNRCYCYSPVCVLHTQHGSDVVDVYQAKHNLSQRDAITALAFDLGLIRESDND